MKSITTTLKKIGVTMLAMLVAFMLVIPSVSALSFSQSISTTIPSTESAPRATSSRGTISSSPSANAINAVMWADGNLSGGAQAGNGGECPLLMIGNYSTGQGIYSGGTGTEPCWSSSISPVQPGETYNLEVKFKNIGTTPAYNTNVRITPNPLGSSSPITSRTYTATVSANGVSESDTVSVNLASAQSVSIYGVYVNPSPYGGQNNYYTVPAATVSGSGVNVGTVQPGEYGYVVIALTVDNAPVVTPAVSTNNATNVLQNSATLNGSLDAGSNFSSVWFRYATGSVSCSSGTYASVSGSNLSAPYSFSAGISGLASSTTYNFIACGQNNGQTYSGSVRTFTTPSAQQTLTVATDPATNITSTSATMPGHIVSGNNYSSAWIRYSTGNVSCSTGTYLNAGSNLNAGQNFSVSQGGLTPATTYNFIACAQNGNTTVPGMVRSFTTSNTTQTGIAVQTNQPSSVSTSMVTMQGACITGPLQSVWFDMRVSGNVSSTSSVVPTVPCGSFTRSITPPATTFEYRACGSNQSQQACGAWVLVTTSTPVTARPAIDTLSATSIGEDDATLRGQTLNATFSSVWFAYSSSDTTPECQNGGDTIVSVSGNNFSSGTIFSENESGLDDDTTYYVRACGIESGSLVSGDVEDFTTDDEDNDNNDDNDDELEIVTLAPTNIDSHSATLRGEIEEGDNYDDAWFAYSSSDTTPECSGNDDTIDVSGNDFDEGDTLSKSVSNLNDNTTYYVRVCAENDGDDVQGNVKTFTTDSDTTVTPTNATYPTVQTLPVSGLTNTSVVFNGAYATRSCTSLQTYIIFGRSATSMTNQTRITTHGKNTAGAIQEFASNLVPGTRYYYQMMGNCEGDQLFTGSIESFVTPTVKGTGVVATGGSCLQMEITNDIESVTPGQYVTYRVHWNNECTTAFKNTIISVHMPKELEFITTSHGMYTGPTEHNVMINIEEIKIDDEDFAVINTRVKNTSRIGDLVVVQADMGGENEITGAGATAFDIDQVVESRGAFGASAFGSGFLNNPLLWIGALLLIILALFAARSAYFAGERRGRAGGYAPVYAAMQHPAYHPSGAPAYYPPHTPVAYAQPQYYAQPGAVAQAPAPVTEAPRVVDSTVDPDPNAYTLYQPKAYNPKA